MAETRITDEALVECVPNFSEGRDRGVAGAIADAIAAAPGARVLDVTCDSDHNRSVVTFVAAPQAIGEAALRGAAEAVRLIDLTKQSGVHPRIGAADVVPFVPVRGVTLADCAAIAVKTGEEFWNRLRVPVYLYEAAARRVDRLNLEGIRRGGFEALREQVAERPPDIGEPRLHPTAGASVIGARKFLIAFNINLESADVDIARQIARKIRTSSGGMPCVKALGLPLASRGLVQVSMNLVRNVDRGRAISESRIVHAGRTLTVVESRVCDDGGRLLCIVTSTHVAVAR